MGALREVVDHLTFKREIHQYLEGSSLRALEKETGISRTRLDSILKKDSRPSMEEINILLEVFDKKQLIFEYTLHFYPEFASNLIDSYVVDPIANKVMDSDIEKLLLDAKYHNIMTICSMGSGASPEVIKEKYGQYGVKHARELLKMGVLKQVGGKLHCNLDHLRTTIDGALKRIALSTEYYDPARRGKHQNAAYYRPFRASKKTLKKVHAKLLKFVEESQEIIRNEYDPNDELEVNFIGIIMDNYDEPNYSI